MRKMLLPALVGLLLLPASLARADNPRTVIEKAIKAHGGAEKLSRLKAVRSKAKGTIDAKAKGTIDLGADTPFTLETVWSWPDKLKNTITLEAGKRKYTRVETVAGDDSWVREDGKTVPMSAAKRDELRAQAHLHSLLRLTPLLRDPRYKLSALAETQIDGGLAAGVRVACPGERDVSLYFDVETGRLVKLALRRYDDLTRKEVLQEEYFRAYEDRDGLPTATKQIWHRDGKKEVEMTFSEVRYPQRIDADEFADPRSFTRRRDVIYGYKNGVALTMDVFAPHKDANGVAIIAIVSGGWHSDPLSIDSHWAETMTGELLKRGYTVFAVCHGSQPLFTIPDAIADVNRAARFIRRHAHDYAIDPYRLGVTGGSAGGHLSLMLGVAGDKGDARSLDPVGAHLQPSASGGLFLSADGLSQLRRRRPERLRRQGRARRLPHGHRRPRVRSAQQAPRTSHRQGQDRGAVPARVADHARQRRRSADADRPRRRRQAGAHRAGRGDGGEAEERRRARGVDRQEGGRSRLARHGARHDRGGRLVR